MESFGARFAENWCAFGREGPGTIELKDRTPAVDQCRVEFSRHRIPYHVAGGRYRRADTLYTQMGLFGNNI